MNGIFPTEDQQSPVSCARHENPAQSTYTNNPPLKETPRCSSNSRGSVSSRVDGAAGGVQRFPHPGWKRALDITLIVFLLPLWLPIMVILALFIRLTSPGPVFFRQERVGQGAGRFMCLKFRSMKVNAETQSHERHLEKLMRANTPMTKLDARGDSRLIFGGGIMRATGLDELPQIFNVLQGTMSLVGPRPCTPFEYGYYEDWQKRRVEAPAGLTGYWQVNGKNRTTFKEMIQMDIFYAENMSLWMDLGILFRTLPALAAQFIESRMKKFSLRQAQAAEGANSVLTTASSL